MTKKNLVSLVLASALLLTLAACGEKAPSGSGSGSGAESTSASGSQAEQPKVAEVTGGSERESAEKVPLDTKLKGKTVREETQWFSFTTDETENATYAITSVNQTPETSDLRLSVYDEEENQLNQYPLDAGHWGGAATLNLDLLTETTYYVKVWADKGDVISYSLILRSPEGQEPENNVAQPGPEAKDELEIFAATNQDDAQLIPLNARLDGKVSRGEGQWYAFSTNSAENATYRLTTVNMTRGTGALNLKVLNQYGEQMHQYTLNAEQSGKASTLDLELPPDTTYYIYIWAEKGDIISYSLIIRDPEEQKSGYSTAGSLSESVGAVAGQEILAGTNQDEGGMIPLETEVSGKVSDGRGQWYAFTTNSVENATYEVTTVNKTPGTGDFCLRVYNMYGETMHWYSLNANQSGEAATESMQLSPQDHLLHLCLGR